MIETFKNLDEVMKGQRVAIKKTKRIILVVNVTMAVIVSPLLSYISV